MNDIQPCVALFVCGGCHIIEEGELENMKRLEEEHGGQYIHPFCSECHAELGVGDQIDGFHPYHQDYNYCKRCKDYMKKPSKKEIDENLKEAYENKCIALNPKEEWVA